MHKFLKYIKDGVKQKYAYNYSRIYCKFAFKRYLSKLYRKTLGKNINWTTPNDLNEKINWLAANTDTSIWSRLADKYSVREYVKDRGFEDILVPLYAKWDTPEEIDFISLPDKFVLKMNNGCGDVIVINDKNKTDINEVKNKFRHLYKYKFGYLTGEPHYLRIKPAIIAEKYLDSSQQASPSSSLIDYKVWCFNGIPEIIRVYSNRSQTVEVSTFDIHWNYKIDLFIPSYHFIHPLNIPTRPINLSRMLTIASFLSTGFPQVRVDFYEVDGKLFFGELTFTSSCGRMTNWPQKYLEYLGNKVKLT